MAKNLKPGKKFRVAVDFYDLENALGFLDTLREVDTFAGEQVSLREADALDLAASEAYTLLLRSRADVQAHPGAVDPLPEREEGQSLDDYRKGLSAVQQAALDLRIKEKVGV